MLKISLLYTSAGCEFSLADNRHLFQVSAENLIGLQEPTKVSMIAKVRSLLFLVVQDCSVWSIYKGLELRK